MAPEDVNTMRFLPKALSVKVKKFKQTRVNGGINYDSLQVAKLLRQLGLPLRKVWYQTAQPESLRHQRLRMTDRMTGTKPHAPPQGTAGRGPNWDSGPRAGHAGAARRCTERHSRLWAQPGHGPCTGRGSYASMHAHLGTSGRETFWGPLAASGPEELQAQQQRTYPNTHAYFGTAGRGTRKGTVGCERAGGAA
jgi:hypothetical protein